MANVLDDLKVSGRTLAAAGVLLPVLLLVAIPAAAQQPSTDPVLGEVVDAETLAPLANVLVTVRAAADSAVAATGLTDSRGRFVFPGVAAGRYTVEFDRLGYALRILEVQLPATEGGPTDLGPIEMSPTALVLDEVHVVGDRSGVIIAADRDIYLVDGIPAAAGGSATDVLENVPDIQMDVDGSVTVRGERPTIYINGRPAPMTGESLTIFLQGFPAENIESVEVMENPSARYEAEGTGGIVNLVLRRGASIGLNGNAFLNGGSRGDIGTGGRATYIGGPWRVLGGSSLRLSNTETITATLRENHRVDPAIFLRQDAISERSRWSGNFDLTTEYSLSEKTRLSAESRVSRNSSDADRLTNYTEMDFASVVTDEYQRSIADDGGGYSADINLELTHEFERRVHELSVETRYRRGRDSEDSRIIQRALAELEFVDFANELTWEQDRETEEELRLSVDYARPWGDGGQFEVGYRGQVGNTDEGRRREVGIDGSAEVPITTMDTGFRDRQAINAAYLTLIRRLGELNAQVGFRAEHAARTLELPGDHGTFANDHLGFFPNANLTYALGGGKRLRMSYSMRINRPSSSVLNPTNTSDDPLNRRVGNPDIDPQRTHSLGLNASWSGAIGTLRFAPFYRRSLDRWGRLMTLDENGVSTRTYENLGSSTSYGTSVNASIRNYKGIGGSINLSGQHQFNEWGAALAQAPRSSTRWSVRTNLNGRISSATSLTTSLTYNPARDLPQGRAESTVMTRFGLRQRLFENRVSLNLNVTDPLELYQPRTVLTDRTFAESGRERASARRFTASMSYNFGGGGRGGGGRPPGAGGRGR